MDLAKIAKTKTPIGGKNYYTDGTKYFTEYKLINKEKSQGGDKGKGLQAIAKDQVIGKGSKYTDILRWKNSQAETIPSPEYKIDINDTLLLPADDPVSDFSKLTISATSGVNVRTGHSRDFEVLIDGKDTKNNTFEYRKSSVFDDAPYVWAEVTLIQPKKDKAGTEKTTGWICVKQGPNYYTDPHIDK